MPRVYEGKTRLAGIKSSHIVCARLTEKQPLSMGMNMYEPHRVNMYRLVNEILLDNLFVHLVRASLDYVPWKARKPVEADLRQLIYRAGKAVEAEQHNCASVRGYTASVAFGNSFQPVYAGDEDVLYAPVLQFRQHLQLERRAFRLCHRQSQHFLLAVQVDSRYHVDRLVLDVALVPHFHHQCV
jgi:hypothetical protein